MAAVRRLTQEELLAEAKITEQINIKSLGKVKVNLYLGTISLFMTLCANTTRISEVFVHKYTLITEYNHRLIACLKVNIYRSSKFDPFCLHWSCSPLTVNVNCRRGANPMQGKWIKPDLVYIHEDMFNFPVRQIQTIIRRPQMCTNSFRYI